jgi:hypothetical protein
VGTGDDEEDLLSVVDSNVEGLLVVLHERGQWEAARSGEAWGRVAACPLSVESADDKVLKVTALVAIVVGVLVLIVILLDGLALALGLDAVGLSILHILIVVVVGTSGGGLEELLDGGILLLLLGLGGITGSSIGLLIILAVLIAELGTVGGEDGLELVVIELVILVVIEARVGALHEAEGRAGDSRHVTLGIGLRLLSGIDSSHGDAEL